MLETGLQSTLDVFPQEQLRQLVGEGNSPGVGISPGRRERLHRECFGLSTTTQEPWHTSASAPNTPQGSRPGRAVWAKPTPLAPPPRCLPQTGLLHKEKGFPGRRDFPPDLQLQREGTVRPCSWLSPLCLCQAHCRHYNRSEDRLTKLFSKTPAQKLPQPSFWTRVGPSQVPSSHLTSVLSVVI